MPVPKLDTAPNYQGYNDYKKQWDQQQAQLTQNIQQGDDFNPWLRLKMAVTNLPLTMYENQQASPSEGLYGSLGLKRQDQAQHAEDYARALANAQQTPPAGK